jgi:DNA ligase
MKAFFVWLRVGLALFVLLGGTICSEVAAEPSQLMLPHIYEEQDIIGWWMSEKLDGIRGYWDGQQLFSKTGRLLSPSSEFTATLPPFPVEGELWGGRNSFEQTASIVQREKPHAGWMTLKFGIFDLPRESGSFRQRLSKIKAWSDEHQTPSVFVIKQIPVRSLQQFRDELQRIENLGGEGLIVRDPDARYESGRSMSILKVKSFQDAEASVIAYLPGKGKHEGRLGALLVEGKDGTQFRIGTGFSDSERDNPPQVGAIITYKYYGRYQSGLPKFPSFLRVREDTGW